MVSGAGVWAVQAASGAAIHLDGTSVANTNTSITAANKLAGGVLSHGQATRVTILNNPSISVAGSGSNTTYMTMAVTVTAGGYISLDGGTVSTAGGTLTLGLYAPMGSRTAGSQKDDRTEHGRASGR